MPDNDNKPLNAYTFLPYLRIGLANRIGQNDQDSNVKQRAGFMLKLELQGDAVGGGSALAQNIEKQVDLYGPGDIVGIDKKVIFKTEPHNWITNFESNYLPYIEFYEEDFPWRYTPYMADEAQHRLRPWLALVVLEEGEFQDGKNIHGKPLPYITVEKAKDAFPPAEQLWAWAHVHINSDLAESAAKTISTDKSQIAQKVEEAMGRTSDIAYSRILCPRKLKPNAAYHAFLVPSYESGRQAGLGYGSEGQPAYDPGFATKYAWGAEEQSEFPYYHRWYFRTGTVGDFEYLVRLLEPKPADERVGQRDMDVQEPGWNIAGLDPAGELGGILKLGGALRVPNEAIKDKEAFNKYDRWAENGYPQQMQQDIAAFVNLVDDYQKPGANPQPIPDGVNAADPDPLISPPLYGRWHAAVDRLLSSASGTPLPHNSNWIHELNLDPRFRVSAGFGTRVVQDKQEDLMDSAWQQAGDVLKANTLLRQAQLTRSALGQWHEHMFVPLAKSNPERLLLLTAPVQKRVLMNNITVFHQIKMSPVPPVAFSTPMRKLLRPGGRVTRKPQRGADLSLSEETAGVTQTSLLRGLNSGEVVASPPKGMPAGLRGEETISAQVEPDPQPAWLAEVLRSNPKLPSWILWLAVLMALLALLIMLFYPAMAGVLFAAAGVCFAAQMKMAAMAAELARPKVFAAAGVSPSVVDQAPKSPDFRLVMSGDAFKPSVGAVDSEEGARFKAALKNLFAIQFAAHTVAEQPPKLALDLPFIASGIVQKLHPDATLPRLVLSRILLPQRYRMGGRFEFFEPIMAYPQFDMPMYKPLVGLSTEYFLPNINLIAQNSITMLETNQKFIESYMVGLNHEMARELLWREYPTDQRGSYFRQFWDVNSYLPPAGEGAEGLKEKLKDIPEIHRWKWDSELGGHDNREAGGAKEEEVVLVIRGELLKKYPTAVIYAHKAEWATVNPNGTGGIDISKERGLAPIPEGLEDDPPRTIVKTPLYSAKVEPDIYFFGFDLTSAEARGSDGTQPGDEDKPGWFFIIKERPGEPRFGLDIDSNEGRWNVRKKLSTGTLKKAPGGGGELHTWNDLAWKDVAPGIPEGGFIKAGSGASMPSLVKPADQDQAEYEGELAQYEEDKEVKWGPAADAADLAYILYQVPVMVAVHAREMLPHKADA